MDNLEINKLIFFKTSYEFNSSDFDEIDVIESSRHTVKHHVYRKLKLPLAVKLINLPQSRFDKDVNQGKLQEISKEIKHLRTLSDCSNIVQFYGIGLHANQIWICMELMDSSLHDFYILVHKAQNKMDEDILGFIAHEILAALSYCKAKNIMHRDVKPKNVLLNRKGEVKLCDFGESRFLKDSLASTFVGTVAYMPPERFNLRPGVDVQYDIRSDIWSFGITMLEIANGAYPFTNKDGETIKMSNLLDVPKIIMSTNMYELIQMCLIENYSTNFCEFVYDCVLELDVRPKTYDDLMERPFYVEHMSKKKEKSAFMISTLLAKLIDPGNNRNGIIVKHLDKKALISDPRLLSAARENNIDLVRTLLEQSADPNIKDDQGNTALHLAAENKDDNNLLVELLLEYGAVIDRQNEYGFTCLMWAARNNNIKIVRCLLQNGADINKKDSGGRNVLHCAAGNENDNKFIIELLLKKFADIDSIDKDGVTCLMYAAINNNIEIIRCLLQNGADINIKNNYGSNVLHYAAGNKKDNKFIIELLLKHGADIDIQDEDGNICLMHAAGSNNIEIVRCLLRNGANINKQNRFGNTALDRANKEILELLRYYTYMQRAPQTTYAPQPVAPQTARFDPNKTMMRCRFWPNCRYTEVECVYVHPKKRCANFPNCQFGEKCLFIHPTKHCANFPNCQFGEKCLFIHPKCKFDSNCTKPNCPYIHTRQPGIPTTKPSTNRQPRTGLNLPLHKPNRI